MTAELRDAPVAGGRTAARKAMGAYYTAPDVTDYLCTSTLLPWLCEGVRLPLADGEVLPLEEGITRNLDLKTGVGEWIRREADEEQVVRLWRRLQRLRVLDPTCGPGAFLLGALEVLALVWEAALDRLAEIGAPEQVVGLALLRPATRRREVRKRIIEGTLFGVDLDPAALEVCRERLIQEWQGTRSRNGHLPPLPNLVCGNAVSGLDWRRAFPEVLAAGGFDVILGNPPYVGARAVSYRAEGFATAGCPNVYAWVVERSFELLHARGHLGMVLPVSAVSGPEYRPLAEQYLRHDCWISTYSNRPAKLFPQVEQRLALLITAPARGGRPGVRTSPYQHWYQGERPDLFRRLLYTPTVLHQGLPVKLGDPLAASAFGKLVGAGDTLKDLVRDGDCGVWLHDGPTYWVRALPFQPNAGSAPGRSSHYRRIPAAGQEEAEVLAALLSSSTFYFWFKAVSNCRDLGRQEWESFPVGKIEPETRKELAQLARQLGVRLKETARKRQRKYPSGTIVYEEYYPSRACEILDKIDAVLARHYGFTEAELDYVRKLDRKYRLGRTRDGGE